MIDKINYSVPSFDRRFDFDKEELTGVELAGRTAEKVNEVVSLANTVDGKIANKEDSNHITLNRKLSPSGNFTGNVAGRSASMVINGIDSNHDKVTYLASQFSEGQTGLVIDGGFFEAESIKKNYDGGAF